MDREMVTERPDDVRRRWEQCPRAGVERAASPDRALTRWKAVRDLIVGWYHDDRPDDEAVPALVDAQLSWMDPVQRLLVERGFAGWRAMFPKDPSVEVDVAGDANTYLDGEAEVALRVATTFALTGPDGETERVRLKTGRRPTTADEAAVLTYDRPQGVVFLDAMVRMGVAEEIVTPDDADTRLGELVEMALRDRRVPVAPGLWCFSCPSAARCGQYPQVDPQRVYVSTRSLVVSKTQLAWLDTCHRRVAWDRVHQVSVDEDDEVELRERLSLGRVFHEMAAAAIVSDDPAAVVQAELRTVADSEASELARLWDNHLALWAADGDPTARTTEYPAGVTIVVGGVHVDSRDRQSVQGVAVTMIGILDVTAREPDGTPMVVEHRTGAGGDHSHLEAELYAVSAAASIHRATGAWPEKLAVHLHLLGPAEPECERREFDGDALAAAHTRLTEAASLIASWHPHDSLDPAYAVGPWCGSCHHRPICENFRG